MGRWPASVSGFVKAVRMSSVFRICIGHDDARVVETGNRTPDGMGRRESRDSDASMETIAWSGFSTAVGAIDGRRQSVPRDATGHDRGDHSRRKPGDRSNAHRGRQKHDIHVAGVVRARRGERGGVAVDRIRQDMRRRYETMGSTCAEWSSRRPPEAASLVLVTPESAMTGYFQTFINRLRAMQQLERIVVDECHVTLTEQWDFRPQLQQLGRLIWAETQMILLTATLRPRQEMELYGRIGFVRDEVRMFRSGTSHANIRYRIVRGMNSGRHQIEFLTGMLRSRASGKMIVYSNTVSKVQRLAQALDCGAYHHHATDKDEIFQRSMQGTRRVVVATSAFGLGIDLSDIRMLVHMDVPRSMEEYAQESGRTGRDGDISEVFIMIRSEAQPSSDMFPDSESRQNMKRFTIATEQNKKSTSYAAEWVGYYPTQNLSNYRITNPKHQW